MKHKDTKKKFLKSEPDEINDIDHYRTGELRLSLRRFSSTHARIIFSTIPCSIGLGVHTIVSKRF